MPFSYSQDSRHGKLAAAPHRPSFRASDVGARGRETQPVPRRRWKARESQRPYHGRSVPGIADDQLEALSHEDLLNLRDKVAFLLADQTFDRTRVPAVVRDIMERAAAAGGVDLGDMLSKRRTKDVARPRQRAMASCMALRKADGKPRFSSLHVARMFHRDHSTVLHAVEVIPEHELLLPADR